MWRDLARTFSGGDVIAESVVRDFLVDVVKINYDDLATLSPEQLDKRIRSFRSASILAHIGMLGGVAELKRRLAPSNRTQRTTFVCIVNVLVI